MTDRVIRHDTVTLHVPAVLTKDTAMNEEFFSKKHWNFRKFNVTTGFSHFKCISCIVDDFLERRYVLYFGEDSGHDYTRGPDVLTIKLVTRNAGQFVLVKCRCLALISR